VNPEFTREDAVRTAADDSSTAKMLLAVTAHCNKNDLWLALFHHCMHLAHKEME